MNMNFDHIMTELQTQLRSGMKILTEKGHILGQAGFITLITVAVLGVLICFFGLKLVRLLATISGLAVGFLGGAYLAEYFGLEGDVPLIIGAVAGLILAVLGIRFYKAGVFWVSWILGIAGSAYIIRPEDWRFSLVCVVIGLIVGLITLKFVEPATMLLTALFGGCAAGQATYIMLPLHNDIIGLAIIAAFVILGIVVQFLQESRKRKRQHLKKAEEIRNIHSTANEVDKARAMMENLDGQAEGTDDAERSKQAVDATAADEKAASAKTDRAKVGADVLDLDSIADYDDELDDDDE